jgi:c-di-AMP phosphodiesterase-like protein
MLGLLLWSHGGTLPNNGMPGSIAGLFIALIYGLLCNANWLLTGISVVLISIITLIYYSIVFSYTDFTVISVLGNTMVFYFIALYKTEKRDKIELL